MAEPDSELLSALSSFLERAQGEEQVTDANQEAISKNDSDFKQRLAKCERVVNGLQE